MLKGIREYFLGRRKESSPDPPTENDDDLQSRIIYKETKKGVPYIAIEGMNLCIIGPNTRKPSESDLYKGHTLSS